MSLYLSGVLSLSFHLSFSPSYTLTHTQVHIYTQIHTHTQEEVVFVIGSEGDGELLGGGSGKQGNINIAFILFFPLREAQRIVVTGFPGSGKVYKSWMSNEAVRNSVQ